MMVALIKETSILTKELFDRMEPQNRDAEFRRRFRSLFAEHPNLRESVAYATASDNLPSRCKRSKAPNGQGKKQNKKRVQVRDENSEGEI